MLGTNEQQGKADEKVPAAATETSAPQNTGAFEHERHRPNAVFSSLVTKMLPRLNRRCRHEKPGNQKKETCGHSPDGHASAETSKQTTQGRRSGVLQVLP